MTFDAGSGPKVGLVTDKGVIDLTDRLGVLSLKNLIANQQFNEVLPPLVSKGKNSGLKLKGLRLESKSASALINAEWRHTDSGKIGIYVFNNKKCLLS